MKFLKSTLQFDKRKAIIGAALMALTLMICAVCNLWSLSLFGVGFFMVGCIRLNITRRWKYTLYFVWVAATAAVTLVAPLTMLEQPQQMSETVMSLILNFVCIFIVCGVIFIFTAKPRWSVAVGTFLLICLAVVNSFIYQFRGKELGYGDIFSLKTALNVVGQYKARFTAGIIYGFIRWLFVVFIGFSVPGITILSKLRARIISLVSVTALMLVLVFGASNIPIKTWGDEGSRFNGYYLNFYLSIRDSIVKKPKNYNTKNVDNIAQKYVLPDGADKIESKPNVIVIMNESFADFRSLGTLSTNKPVTPFLDSLTEDIVRGYAMSSVYGGNTANSEFEFLTGHSMMFLPENSVPYQQYINNKTNSMAWIMNSYGYKTMATHPYYANGWSRNIVYPYLGFKEITFIEEYTVNHPVREYVSDRDMAEYILKKLDSKDKDTPLFLFGITMQNHGGYDYSGDDFEQKINLEGYDSEYPKAEQYLSLIHETDSAMEYLLTNLKNYSEDTVVLFFGDHLPGIEEEFYEELYGSFETLSDQMLRFKVPFIIWANYDIPEKYVECTSINYLSGYLLEAAGLPLSPYHRFLKNIEKIVPSMSSPGYYSYDWNKFIPYNKADGTEKQWLDKYAAMVYNDLFDIKNRNEIFFKQN